MPEADRGFSGQESSLLIYLIHGDGVIGLRPAKTFATKA
jgi:hypothetical protein